MKSLALAVLVLAATAGAAWSQADRLSVFGLFVLQPFTFTTLPVACGASAFGAITTISDSTTATWGATVAGGGSNKVLAWCNGANWTVIGK